MLEKCIESQHEVIRDIVSGYSTCCAVPHLGLGLLDDHLKGTHPEVIRAIRCSCIRNASQSEVVRSIVLEDSPCCGDPTPQGRDQ